MAHPGYLLKTLNCKLCCPSAGLHLGLLVVVTKSSGPHGGKSFLCWYGVSSSLLKWGLVDVHFAARRSLVEFSIEFTF
jgi:hypothetical protein